jgi:Tol biopolymer transport system component
LSPLGENGVCAIGGSTARSHIYVRDRQAGTTTRVSVDSAGIDGNSDSFDPNISDDGRFVTFYSRASNLVANDTNTCAEFPPVGMCEDVFVHDLVTGITERISVADSGAQGDRPSRNPSISGDGRFVAFESWATNLVSGDTNSMSDVFLKDRLAGTLRRASLSVIGGELDGPSYESSLSQDGRYLSFMSGATNVVQNDINYCLSDVPPSCPDVFAHDSVTGRIVMVSVSSDGTQGEASSSVPRVSADGGRIAFASSAPNLVAEDTNFYDDIFLHNLGDVDGDGEWDPFDACPTDADCDSDGFGDGLEVSVGTDPLASCGLNAWPADINNSGYSDMSDIFLLTGRFGEAVPPAPVRYDIAPEPPKPPGKRFIDISDIVRLTGVFGLGCG